MHVSHNIVDATSCLRMARVWALNNSAGELNWNAGENLYLNKWVNSIENVDKSNYHL